VTLFPDSVMTGFATQMIGSASPSAGISKVMKGD